MPITLEDYVPILKWRQGEYQALLRLTDAIKDRTVPLIEVTPPDFDFELEVPTKTIDEHLVSFGPRLEAKWGARLALIDCGLLPPDIRMKDGRHPMLYIYEETAQRGATVVPVTRLGSDAAYHEAVRFIQSQALTGLVLRCSLDDAVDPDFDEKVTAFLSELEVGEGELDVVLDLESPNWDPEDGLVALVTTALSGAGIFDRARSVVLAGSSFPDSMASVTGPIEYWARREWSLYRTVRTALPADARKPAFGDYAIAGPGYAQGDMRLLKPSATIRYTCDDGWIIAKGKNVRDYGFGQYRTCSGSITGSSLYLGAGYSPGSAYVDGCHLGSEKTGNLTTWRWVGTNHHITKVVNDLASLPAS